MIHMDNDEISDMETIYKKWSEQTGTPVEEIKRILKSCYKCNTELIILVNGTRFCDNCKEVR